MKFVLASTSPRRKELLTNIGLPFEIIPSNIDEVINDNISITENVERLAYQKAFDVSQNLPEGYLVLGADTVVILDGKIIGKPKDVKDAKRMLTLLSERTHNVITAIAIVPSQDESKKVIRHENTKVKFRKLSEDEIENYISTGEPMDKAGSYAMQGMGCMIVEHIEGCYTNVIGLPIPLLVKVLKNNFNIKLL